ncbi:MAG: RNA methyltransferase [Balneolales bacterium]|nr:RNA methyltransferase [Balneolales bacterium]
MNRLSKKQLQLYAGLKSKKNRTETGLFLIEGERQLRQVVEHGMLQLEAVITDEAFFSTGFAYELEEMGRRKYRNQGNKSWHYYTVSNREMQRLSDTKTPQGVLAVAKQPSDHNAISLLEKAKNASNAPIIVALDGVSDPGNVGTIYRTAVWFGVSAMLCGSGTADLYNPKVVRSTAGATGVLPSAESDLPEILPVAASMGYRVLLLDLQPEAKPLGTFMKMNSEAEPCILVAGNEANGISEQLRQQFEAVYISGNQNLVESLNAAVSMGIVLQRFANG